MDYKVTTLIKHWTPSFIPTRWHCQGHQMSMPVFKQGSKGVKSRIQGDSASLLDNPETHTLLLTAAETTEAYHVCQAQGEVCFGLVKLYLL